jgi:hypothetical protein
MQRPWTAVGSKKTATNEQTIFIAFSFLFTCWMVVVVVVVVVFSSESSFGFE